ncbi:beta strand repeat-containing protein [Aequorivita flava]|uniref:C1q domain-containing protein n=1 Tax=Aequorivita flava TaxID=3114371 RepID=A0AB35YVP0_9FLAO
MRNITFFLFFLILSFSNYAQVGIGTVSPNPSSVLDITSDNEGILIPRVALLSTTDVTTIASPATSLMLYNTNTAADVVPGYYYWSGAKWMLVATTNMIENKWDTSGNAGTDQTTNFLGTTDNQDLVFKRNNALAGRLALKSTAFGLGALSATLTSNAIDNTAIGINVLQSNTSAYGSTGVGFGVLTNSNGDNNTAIGRYAMHYNLGGFANTSAGAYALENNINGTHNTAIGYTALRSNTSGGYNTAVGFKALKNNINNQENTAVGYGALENNNSYNNTATGAIALQANTSGRENTANGRAALLRNTTGNENTAMGSKALLSNTTGYRNTSSGMESLLDNTTGFQNTANGTRALNKNTTGSNNNATGNYAMRLNTTGSGNVAIGGSALDDNISGNNNTGIGYLSNVASENLTNATAIGYNAIVSTNNSLVLGSVSPPVNVGIGVTNPSAKLEVYSTTANTSGLKLTRLTSASPVATGATIGVDATGNVVTVPGAAPVVIYTGSLGNGSGGSVNATITASGFNTVPLPNTSTNIGGGIWNGTNNTYTIPVSGTYLIKSSIRLTDGSVSRNVFQAVHTSNADIPDGIWQTNSGNRWTMLYTRIAYFNQNDVLRLYIYSDGQQARLSDASLNITLLSKS